MGLESRVTRYRNSRDNQSLNLVGGSRKGKEDTEQRETLKRNDINKLIID